MEYMQDFQVVIQTQCKVDKKDGVNEEVLKGASCQVDLDFAIRNVTCYEVLTNTNVLIDQANI